MHAEPGHHGAVGRNHVVAQQLVARRVAVASDATRLPQTAERATGHGPERPGPRILTGREDRAKRIEVVTGDDRLIARQAVDEVRVAVIDDVEEVEPAVGDLASQPSRVVPDAVQQAVCRRREPGRPATRPPAEPGTQWRTEPLRVHLPGEVALQMMQEPVGDQIHARPVLLHEIADDADADWSLHGLSGCRAGAPVEDLGEELDMLAGNMGPGVETMGALAPVGAERPPRRAVTE